MDYGYYYFEGLPGLSKLDAALMMATKKGWLGAVKALVEHGADAAISNYLAFDEASRKRDVNMLLWLSSRARPTHRAFDNSKAWHDGRANHCPLNPKMIEIINAEEDRHRLRDAMAEKEEIFQGTTDPVIQRNPRRAAL